jgi:hypothetical protein
MGRKIEAIANKIYYRSRNAHNGVEIAVAITDIEKYNVLKQFTEIKKEWIYR